MIIKASYQLVVFGECCMRRKRIMDIHGRFVARKHRDKMAICYHHKYKMYKYLDVIT